MQFHFFSIPAQGPEEEVATLNRFLAGHRILAVDRHFVAEGPNSRWAICVSIDHGPAGMNGAMAHSAAARRGKVDYKDVFSPPEFAVYARLRELRKGRAEAEGVPAYAVFTNEQLAEMVQRRVTSAAALREIAGIGEARVEKYGPAFLDLIEQAALPASVAADDAA